jgi:hypothetical protein
VRDRAADQQLRARLDRVARAGAPHDWLRHPLSGHDPQEGDDEDRDSSFW